MPDAQTIDPAPAPTEAERLAAQPPTVCLNCGADLPGRFCPDCGQRDQPLRQPAHVFIAESLSEYFGLDGRLWRTLRMLLFQPGALTVAYLDGRRARYLRPLRIYLTATVLFFFLLSLQDPFEIQTQTLEVAPLRGDSLTVEVVDDALHERMNAVEAEQAAILTATTALIEIGADSLTLLADSSQTLADSLDAVHDRLGELPDDSLIAVSTLPERVQASLRDSLSVEVPTQVNKLIGDGLLDSMPDWAKGDLARRYESTESPAERRLLSAQVQRAVLRQIPTALFIVLPIFALLLKGLYAFGMGRRPRRRPRPPSPPASASLWTRWGGQIRLARWRWHQWRAHRGARRRRRRLALARQRPVRGLLRRSRHSLSRHARLRRWRVLKFRLLRRSLRMERNPYYAEHLVFALHTHAFTFTVFVALMLVQALSGPSWMATVLGVSIPLYFLLAQKRVYGQPWVTTLAKATVLGAVYAVVLSLGIFVAGGLALRLG